MSRSRRARGKGRPEAPGGRPAGGKMLKPPEREKRRSAARAIGAWLGISAVVFAALLAVSYSRSAAEFVPEVTGIPSLRVDREKIDLGDVPLGRQVKATFTLTNVGDEPLRFTRAPYVRVAEGC